jgi:hypothetical protein
MPALDHRVEMSPASRVRRAFLRAGILVSALAFFLVGGSMVCDQWIAGYASAGFIIGTALLNAGASLALFAVLAGIGSAISIAFSDEAPPPRQQ